MNSTIESHVDLFFLSVTLIMAYVLFTQWKSYCLDKFRQELYIIRYRLFQDAALDEYDFDFENEGYSYLREYIHDAIKSAHVLMPIKIISFIVLEWLCNLKIKPAKNYNYANLSLSEASKKRLAAHENRVDMQVLYYMLKTSPIALLLGGWVLVLSALFHGLTIALDRVLAKYKATIKPVYNQTLVIDHKPAALKEKAA